MFENQALEPRIFEDLERVRGSSTPNPGTIQGLTFNLFSILTDQHLSANALFWITVWITAVDRDPRTAFQGSSFKRRVPNASRPAARITLGEPRNTAL